MNGLRLGRTALEIRKGRVEAAIVNASGSVFEVLLSWQSVAASSPPPS
jgi:hypothetical protein